ncbi:hypothetical protein J6590_018555 [Homalodisca vitripennis]|nr:hypothetical protein J6590_018555 [Homalodisca vitripennis]
MVKKPLKQICFIPVLEHPPYPPVLASCDSYLFPRVKSALKKTRFESVEAAKEKAAQFLKELTYSTVSNDGKFVGSIVGI